MKKVYLRSTRNLYFKMEDGMKVFYSYSTPVAFQPRNSSEVVVCENVWSITTAKHLNWIEDWAGYPRKQNRLKRSEFVAAFDKAKGESPDAAKPDPLKTVNAVSAMFGLMCGDDTETKVKFQKRFLETVPGINFPDDWDSLSVEEKEKRLNAVQQVSRAIWLIS